MFSRKPIPTKDLYRFLYTSNKRQVLVLTALCVFLFAVNFALIYYLFGLQNTLIAQEGDRVARSVVALEDSQNSVLGLTTAEKSEEEASSEGEEVSSDTAPEVIVVSSGAPAPIVRTEKVVVTKYVEVPGSGGPADNRNADPENGSPPALPPDDRTVDPSKIADLKKVAEYDFESLKTSRVEDKSGYENHAYLAHGLNIEDSKGVSSKGVDMNGAGEQLTIRKNEDLNFGRENFTIEFWIQVEAGDNVDRGIYYNKGEVGESAIIINTHLNGQKIYFGVRDEEGDAAGIVSTAAVNDGQWHHVAAVRAGNMIKLYIDGKASGSSDSSAVGSVSNFANINIGFSREKAEFRGKLDNLSIYKKALDSGTIQSHASGA